MKSIPFSFRCRGLFAAACIVFGLSGCVEIPKFPTIEPVSPRPSSVSARGAVDVDTLTPTFSWKTAGADAGVVDTFDFGL